jgi:FkbH-like protein
MASFHPEVLILNRRGDPIHMLESLLHTDAFESYFLSEEDQNRHREYELRSARNVEGHGDKLHDFLKSLELRATLEPIGEKNLERVVQMLGKTNQFNLTTRRHKHDAVRRMIGQPGAIGFALKLEDKFGDQGIVALILAVPEEQGTGTLRIDSFLVSCRALSRGVEEVLWSATLSKALETGFSRIEAEYVPTERNQLVANLYGSWGLVPSLNSPEKTHYTLFPVQARPMPDWVEVAFL